METVFISLSELQPELSQTDLTLQLEEESIEICCDSQLWQEIQDRRPTVSDSITIDLPSPVMSFLYFTLSGQAQSLEDIEFGLGIVTASILFGKRNDHQMLPKIKLQLSLLVHEGILELRGNLYHVINPEEFKKINYWGFRYR